MPSHQPLSKEAIEDIKAECFANDITYNYDVLKDWDEDKVRDYFESGGGGEGAAASTVVAPGGVDPFMKEMPAECLWRHNADKSVAVITLNRPQNKNAIDDKITEGLVLAVERIHATPSLRVVFLTGNGAMFCAGGDPKGFLKAQELGMAAKESGGKDENSNSAGDFAELLRQLNSLPVYLVGLANGSAMGGGFGLLCCCDCVYARKSGTRQRTSSLLLPPAPASARAQCASAPAPQPFSRCRRSSLASSPLPSRHTSWRRSGRPTRAASS